MIAAKLFGALNPKQMLAILAGALMVAAVLSFGSYFVPEKLLTGRKGPVSFIPHDYREWFIGRRGLIGPAATGGFILVVAGWGAAEVMARAWQKARNRELANNAILLRVAPRVDEQSKWEAAADLWRAIHSTLARPDKEVWLGSGLHMSLEMVQLAGERLNFYLWAPRSVAETLVRQLRAVYAGLEIEAQLKSGDDGAPTGEIEDYLDLAGEEANWLWTDLGLAAETWRPLRTSFAGDPLVSLLSALEGLTADNTLAAAHFVIRPVLEGWQRGGQAYIRKLRGDDLKQGQQKPRLSGRERDLIKQIEVKGQARGFDLCLRLVVAGQSDGGGDPSASLRAGPSTSLRASLNRLIRVFDQFAAENSLAVRKSGTQAELYRIKQRFFPAGWKKSVVGEQELAALVHLPNRDVSGVSVNRARARVERPSPISFVGPAEKRVVLGRFVDVPTFGNGFQYLDYPLHGLRRAILKVADEPDGSPADDWVPSQEDLDVGIPLLDGRRHFHVIGPTGVGKSTMLLRMIWQYLVEFPEAAVWLQEPHQDLTHKVVKRIPLWREKDVIWLDVMDPFRVLGINPLEAPPEADLGQVVADVMGIIKKVMGASWDTAVQMQEILENGLLAVLNGEPQPTMAHLFKLLSDTDYRFDLTARLNDPIAAPYWQSLEMKKERELDTMLSVPRRRVNAFLRNPIVRRIIAQGTSTVDFRQAIDSGKVILVQLDGRMGEQNRTFIGAMMMYKLFSTIMSRMDIPEEQRRQVAICVDEFQTFVGQSGKEFADILEQARKMGASLTLAHQHLGQLAEGDLVRSVANNTGTKVVFRAEASDAPTFLKWLPELKAVEDLTTLANYRCYVRPLVKGSPQPVCTLYTYADPPIPDPEAELTQERRGEPDPLPPHPGRESLAELERARGLSSDEERKAYLKRLPEAGWQSYLAARRYYDAVRRNQLIEQPEQVPDKLERVRTLVRLGYGTPHYETEALVEKIIGN